MSSVDMMISYLLIQEMIISDIDKKRKLDFLLSMFMRALFHSILNENISLKNQQNIFVIEDEEGLFCTEKCNKKTYVDTTAK